MAGEKQGRSFPSVLFCYSIPAMSSPTQRGQATSPAWFLPPSGLHWWEHLIPQKEGKYSEMVRSHLMTSSSEPAPKTTALGVMKGHGLALAAPVGWCEGGHMGLCLAVVSLLVSLPWCWGWDHLTLQVLAGTAGVRGAGLQRGHLSQGNSSCSSVSAVQIVKANVHRVKVGLTSLAYTIYAVIIHAKRLSTLKETGREMIRQPVLILNYKKNNNSSPLLFLYF